MTTDRNPDFLIIGAQKSGTTWLHQQLATHPQVFMPAGKDDEFFSYLPDKPLAEYHSKFSAAGSDQRTGDSCASYFWSPLSDGEQPQGFNPDIAATISHRLGPSCRLIVLLKDPVQRSVSAYLHHIAHGSLDCNAPLHAAPARLGLTAISHYGHHLAYWLKHFPPQQILPLPAPGAAPAEELLRRCCDFLDLDNSHSFPQPQNTVFAGLRRRWRDDGVWLMLGQRGLEQAERIQRPLPLQHWEDESWVRLVHPAEIAQLRSLLKPDIAQLAELISHHGWQHEAFEHWPDWPGTG
ncbi:MAG: hypothetical protein Tsb002_12780 [Wenzhouxiangellaceae bacterium]